MQVLAEATEDLADGYRFYERQATGLGEYFLDSLWSDIQSLRLYGGVHTVYQGYFRLLAKRFPYAVYYRID
ncbi:MAG: type II toxin-antitoxin system RelE/ParE family toxin, partial [Desulfobulbus sp.]